jgi:hypothetical protein
MRKVVRLAVDSEQWHDFAASFTGAAGALLGLAFVAISFNLDSILKDKDLPGRAIETLVFFAYPLAGSLLLLAPGLSNIVLGIGQALLTAGLAALARIDLPRWRRERGDPLKWRLAHPGLTCGDQALRVGSSSMWRRGNLTTR